MASFQSVDELGTFLDSIVPGYGNLYKVKLWDRGVHSSKELESATVELLQRLGVDELHALTIIAQSKAASTSGRGGGGGGQPGDGRHGFRPDVLTGPALAVIAGALLLYVPPAYAVRKVANQGSQYLAGLGCLPQATWAWLRTRSVKAVAAAGGAMALAVLSAHPPSRSGDPTKRLHPAPPSEAGSH